MSIQSADRSELSGIQKLTTVFLGAMVFVPFLVWHHRQPLSTFYPEVIAIALGSLALVWFLSSKSWQALKLPLSVLLPIVLIFILLTQFSVGMHTYWQDYFLTGGVLLWAAFMMILGRNINQTIVIPTLSWAIFIGGLFTTFLILIQLNEWISVSWISPHVRGGYAANIGQVNHAATYLAVAVGSLIFLLQTERIKLPVYLISIIILLIGLVLTGQRMALLYVITFALFGPLLLRHLTNKPYSNWWIFLILPVFLILNYLIPNILSEVSSSPIQRVVNTATGESTRLLLLQQAWQMFSANPLLGVGSGGFGWQNFQLTDQYPGLTGYADNAHNIVMQLLAEYGVVAGLALLLLAGYWIVGQFKVKLTVERCWILFTLAVLTLHSLLEYPLWYSYFLGIAALVVGMGDNRSYQLPTIKLGRPLAAGVLVFSIFIIGGVIKQYHELEGWYTDRRNGEMTNEEAIDFLYMLAERRDSSLFAPFFDVIIVRALPNNADVAQDKLAMNTKFMHFLPGEIEVYTQVDLLVKTDQQNAASEQLGKAIRQFPELMDWYWKHMTRSLLVDRDTRYFPLIQQLQVYQDEYLGIKDYQ